MSLKITLRGLLAVLAALGIVMLQLPAAMGGTVSAASVRAPRTAAPAHQVAATRSASTPRPHAVSAITETISGVSLSPVAGPVGVALSILGTVATSSTASTPVTVTITDSSGTTTPLTVLTVPATTTASLPFTISATLPLTIATGFGFVNVTPGSAATVALPFFVNSESATVASTQVVTPAASTTGTRGTPITLTLDNYAPGVGIVPTLVYSNASTAAMSVTALSSTPITPDATGLVTPTFTFALPTNIAYGTTAVVSLTSSLPTASYPLTPTGGFPSVTVAPAPTFSISPTAVSAVGVSTTLALSSTSTGGFNILPGTSITFDVGLTGTAPTVIAPLSEVTSTTTGTFTATLQFTPTVAGTYVITASDIGLDNQAADTLQVAVPGPPVNTQYFADGYTGGTGTLAYHDLLSLLNPNVTTVNITNTYVLELSNSTAATTTAAAAPDVVVVTHTIPALSVMDIDVATDIGTHAVTSGPDAGRTVAGSNQKVATIIQTAGYTSMPAVRGVAAERLTERINGTTYSDGDAVLGTSSPSTSYYFAEGYVGATFQDYLVLFNPSPTVTATANIVRTPEGTASTLAPLGPYVLAPYQRITLNMRALHVSTGATGSKSIGWIVNSDHPIVSERTQYFGPGLGSAKAGMSEAQGLTTAAKQLDFAYGSLTGGYDIANPVTGTIVPTSDVQQTIDDRPFITVMNPNIAGQVVAGTVAGTASAPGPSAHVTVSLRGEDGRLLGFFITDVDAGARFTLTTNDLTSSASGIGYPGVPRSAPTRAGVFSAIVTSSERVVAELSNYYVQGPITPSGDANFGAPGLTLVGAPSGETDVLFPFVASSEPVFSHAMSSTVFLYNPGVDPVTVSGTYYGSGGIITSTTYTIAPDQIQIIGQHLTDSGGTGTGTATTTGAPIPAGTLGAEFATVQARGSAVGLSGESATAPEAFVAAVISHSGDASNWWGTQGYYPLPTSCSAVTGCP